VGDGGILPAYVSALEHEIAATTQLISEQGLRVRSVYVGGGTPTALPADLFYRVLKSTSGLIARAREVTVEAGRPDTITEEKLHVIMDSGGTRISVNPQTMHDKTLAAIGRRHTALQTEEAYRLARRAGFRHINMDLIAGLPGENPMMFFQTLDWVLAMKPEALTVHTLSLKRSSDMYRFGDPLPAGDEVEKMVDKARERSRDEGFQPYYLYRQKHMAGNLENVGYAKPGSACLYNIDMMEDMTTVLAMGAGAISKRVWPARKRILRAPNVKDIPHYISRVDEMILRKNALMQGVGKGVRLASALGCEADIMPLELESEA
jgi:coproporphyrinogen dehydrogenase HemZ